MVKNKQGQPYFYKKINNCRIEVQNRNSKLNNKKAW